MRIWFSISFAFWIALLVCPTAARAEAWPPVEIDATTLRFEEALSQPTTIEFIETPLQDVVDFLKDLHGIQIQIDHRSLEDVGIGSDSPITRNLKGISLRSALRLMLIEMDLTFIIRDEVLLITTPEEAETPIVRVYNIQPLLDDEHTADDLIDAIAGAAPREGFHGPHIDISPFRGLLVVKASPDNQRYIGDLLGKIATGLGVKPEKPTVVRDPPAPMPREVRREARPPEAAPDDADPFAGGPEPSDPFGGPDPFQGGTDPFGGGGQADPFGDLPRGDAEFAPMPSVTDEPADPFG